jgi:hypothetical protein
MVKRQRLLPGVEIEYVPEKGYLVWIDCPDGTIEATGWFKTPGECFLYAKGIDKKDNGG